ncbi:MAG TPA: 3-oxoacid CoA-transferase subunit A [Dehalococcoidia bacterium]
MRDKLFQSPQAAIHDLPEGATVMVGGFASAGVPEHLIRALVERGTAGLTVIVNSIAADRAVDALCRKRQVRKAVTSFAVRASAARRGLFEEQYRQGLVELELVPQGTLAERIRAGGAGIGAFYVPVAPGTVAAEGKETRVLNGRLHVLERPLRADFAFIRAHKADRAGNLVYRGAGRNFNAVMATAADVVVAEVDEVVEVGALDPEHVVTPGVYVDRLVVCRRGPVPWYQEEA